MVFGQGQVEINDMAHDNWSQSQKLKDSLVSEVLKVHQNDSTYIRRFKAAEHSWDIFVDMQFELKFPAYESWETRRETYGSQFDMLYYNFRKLYCDLRITSLYDLLED